MLLSPLAKLGGIPDIINPGDFLNLYEKMYLLSGAANINSAGKDLVQGDIVISGGAAINFVLPTGTDLVASCAGSQNLVSPPGNNLYGTLPNQTVQLAWPANVMPFVPGSSFRRTIVNNNSATVTLTIIASSGVSLIAPSTIITVNWREFLIQILNSSPAYGIVMNQTNANAVLSISTSQPGAADMLRNLTPGMSVYGTNIAASTTILSIQPDQGTVAISNNTTATLANNAISFTPTVTVTGVRSGTA